jgi:hypothetical protein
MNSISCIGGITKCRYALFIRQYVSKMSECIFKSERGAVIQSITCMTTGTWRVTAVND